MPKSEATCAQCGKSFSFYPSARPGVTCSPACSLRYQPRKPRRGTETPCETCGKPVYAN
jgi:DNA-directed RNA polymerase subunit RPC12/RpoP